MKFIHFTDTHLVDPANRLHGLNPAARFESCIDSIVQSHSDAECCVMTGDLADAAEDKAYAFFAEQIGRLDMPCFLIVGNHDKREKFTRFFPDTPTDQSGFIQYIAKTSAGVFIMLDTVTPGSHSGTYCEARCAWLRDTLAAQANEPVYLFMHHPPFDIHLPGIDRIGLINKVVFAEIVSPYKNIRHLFFGHAHRPISGSWQGISFSSLRGTNHQVGLDFSSEKIIYVDEAPEYSVVFLSDETIVIHTHSYRV